MKLSRMNNEMDVNKMRKPRILVVGSLVMDLIVSTERFPQSGETVLGLDYQTAPGGKGANQAVQMARLGADVTMVGKVGRDVFGDTLIESAKAAGVHTEYILRSENRPSAVGNIQLETGFGQSANRIIVVSGANMDITPEDVAFLEEKIGEYDMVLLQFEIPMEINKLVASYAAAKGVPVMLNCAPIAPIPPELVRNITYISPNEHEAQILTGIEVKDEASIQAALKAIRDMGIPNALITLGSRGVAFDNGNGVEYSPALQNLDLKDTTAAGDSFVGAFSTATAMGISLAEALRFANYTAAITVCRMGAQPSLPTLDEVLELMRKHGADTSVFEN